MPRQWVDTSAGPIRIPSGYSLHDFRPWLSGLSEPVMASFFRNKLPLDINSARRRKKRRKRKPIETGGAFSRYRERDNLSLSFLHRKRQVALKSQTKIGHYVQNVNGQDVFVPSNYVVVGGDLPASYSYQRTWDQLNPGPPYKSGGPFRTIIGHLPCSEQVGDGTYTNQGNPSNPSGTYWKYRGSFVDDGVWSAGISENSVKSASFSSFTNLSSHHTLAWDKTKPQIPKADIGQFLYELKDLPQMLHTSARAFHNEWRNVRVGNQDLFVPVMPREAADHFLNHQFGWVPFLSDLGKLFDAWNNSIKYISEIVRDNNVWVRRKSVLDESETISVPLTNFSQSGTIPSAEGRSPDGKRMTRIQSNPDGSFSGGYHSFVNRTRVRTWAVGSFKYYRPEFDSTLFDSNSFEMWATVQRLLTLYGARITPTLLYKVTPWTWLGDWFTNLGSHLRRLDDFTVDGIVSRYLYVMRSEEKFATKTCVLNYYSGPVVVQFQRRLSLKQREVADSPYGFNVPWNTMSPRQYAILGAIGISRSNKGFISRGA